MKSAPSRSAASAAILAFAALMGMNACRGLTGDRIESIVEEPERLGEILHARGIGQSEDVRENLEEPGALQHIVNHIKKYNIKPIHVRELSWRGSDGADIKSFVVENGERQMFAQFDFSVQGEEKAVLEKIALYPEAAE